MDHRGRAIISGCSRSGGGLAHRSETHGRGKQNMLHNAARVRPIATAKKLGLCARCPATGGGLCLCRVGWVVERQRRPVRKVGGDVPVKEMYDTVPGLRLDGHFN